MGYLTSGKIFENTLHLKCFGLYFKEFLNRKWLLSYRNNDISYRDKNIKYSYTPGLTLAMGYFAPRVIFKQHAIVDAFLLYFT